MIILSGVCLLGARSKMRKIEWLQPGDFWVAVKELKLSYHNGCIYIYVCVCM